MENLLRFLDLAPAGGQLGHKPCSVPSRPGLLQLPVKLQLLLFGGVGWWTPKGYQSPFYSRQCGNQDAPDREGTRKRRPKKGAHSLQVALVLPALPVQLRPLPGQGVLGGGLLF